MTLTPGDLVTDFNYGRTCAVLAVRPTRVLVAVRMRKKSRLGGRCYQLRWRPRADVRPSWQSASEALALAVAAFNYVSGPARRALARRYGIGAPRAPVARQVAALRATRSHEVTS